MAQVPLIAVVVGDIGALPIEFGPSA
ncbi:hypothetical protein PENFLA_c005G09875 [Penicillium flavigenum]|uniref:Uncharacterized protein n=1 Tax=Penicillium flavigenum TaxID=254877 RepID=A0A1V6TQ69_9EURO|nr:hypothetical protein PENFLA_c005G09875 [Penicillium flavigenum]